MKSFLISQHIMIATQYLESTILSGKNKQSVCYKRGLASYAHALISCESIILKLGLCSHSTDLLIERRHKYYYYYTTHKRLRKTHQSALPELTFPIIRERNSSEAHYKVSYKWKILSYGTVLKQ